MIKFINKKQDGFVALMGVLILATVLAVIVPSLILSSSDNYIISRSIRNSEQALTNAESCAEIALGKIRADNSYVGDETISLPDSNSCVIRPISYQGGGGPVFYRGYNLNDDTITVSGHQYYDDTGLTIDGFGFYNDWTAYTPTPAADLEVLLYSGYWYASNLTITMPSLANGSYEVYYYIVEDDGNQQYDLFLQDIQVANNLNTGNAETWHRAGPYTTSVSSGTLEFRTDGGSALVAGIELYSGGSPSSADIEVYSTAGEHTKRLAISISQVSPQIVISSWNEVSSF